MTEPDGCCQPCDNEEHDLCENPEDEDCAACEAIKAARFTAKLRYMRRHGAHLVVPRGFGAN